MMRGRSACLLGTAVGCLAAACSDEDSWRSSYGEGCSWYAEHDPGCLRFLDVGQIDHCQQTCANCDGSRPVPDPLVTTCAVEDLCSCFEGCDPPVLCPSSDAAQACSEQVLDVVEATRVINESQGTAYLQWDFDEAEQVLGFEVRGKDGSWAMTVAAQLPAASVVENGSADAWLDADGGRELPANWDGLHPVRVSLAQTAQGGAVRLLAKRLSDGSSDLLPMEARPVLRRCKDPPPGPTTALGRCDLLKCKAFCYRSLGCDGEWQAHCALEKPTDGAFCSVDCSGAHGTPLLAAVLFFAAMAG